MAPKTPTGKPYAAYVAIDSSSSASSSSSFSSSGDEHEAEHRRTSNHFILPPVGQQGDSSESDDEEEDDDDEEEEEGEPAGWSSVAAKRGRGPYPPPHLQGLPEQQTPPKGNVHVPSPKLTKPSPLKRTASAAKLAEPSASKKKKAAASAAGKEVAKPAPPSKAAAAVAAQAAGKEVAHDAETSLQEKSETYWYLARALQELERKHNAPGMYNTTFLSTPDGEASILNTKLKKQEMAEAKLFLKRWDIYREIIRTMSNSTK